MQDEEELRLRWQFRVCKFYIIGKIPLVCAELSLTTSIILLARMRQQFVGRLLRHFLRPPLPQWLRLNSIWPSTFYVESSSCKVGGMCSNLTRTEYYGGCKMFQSNLLQQCLLMIPLQLAIVCTFIRMKGDLIHRRFHSLLHLGQVTPALATRRHRVVCLPFTQIDGAYSMHTVRNLFEV